MSDVNEAGFFSEPTEVWRRITCACGVMFQGVGANAKWRAHRKDCEESIRCDEGDSVRVTNEGFQVVKDEDRTMAEKVRDLLSDVNPDAVFFDGFDEAIVGVVTRFNSWEPIVLYDREKCIEILMGRAFANGDCCFEEPCVRHLSYEEAVEYLDYNVTGAWVGEGTPAFLSRPE